MARRITDIQPVGGGLRITWSNKQVSELVWEFIGGQLSLSESGTTVNTTLLNEIINSLPKQYISSTFWEHLFGVSGGAGEGASGLNMALVGGLDSAGILPVVRLGTEIAGKTLTLTTLRGRRDVAGISGTTTIQLEINGVAISGATLSWTSADADLTLKTALIAEPIVPGDAVSFRLTSRESGAENIYIEVD